MRLSVIFTLGTGGEKEEEIIYTSSHGMLFSRAIGYRNQLKLWRVIMNKIIDLCRDCEHHKITDLGWCHGEYIDDEFCAKGHYKPETT